MQKINYCIARQLILRRLQLSLYVESIYANTCRKNYWKLKITGKESRIFRKGAIKWLNVSEAQSNDFVQPTTGPKVCHSRSQHSFSILVVKKFEIQDLILSESCPSKGQLN